MLWLVVGLVVNPTKNIFHSALQSGVLGITVLCHGKLTDKLKVEAFPVGHEDELSSSW